MRSRNGTRNGFTLIELLVVIGIIIVLIGLLLPVFRMVRTAGFNTATMRQISNISQAIDSYFKDFNAYPGPFDDSATKPQLYGTSFTVDNGQGTPITLSGVTINSTHTITSSENLVLGLVGGLTITTNATPAITAFAFNSSNTTFASGPQMLNPSNPSRLNAYLPITSGDISAGLSNLLNVGNKNRSAHDSAIPEFIDRFPDNTGTIDYNRGVILYLRANYGASGITASGTGAQYDTREFDTYLGTGIQPYDSLNFPTWDKFFQDPNITTQPRMKNSYWLISPGADRIYGTRDDLTNFGGFIGKYD